MIQEFNVDSKAECDQLNLAYASRKNVKQEAKLSLGYPTVLTKIVGVT